MAKMVKWHESEMRCRLEELCDLFAYTPQRRLLSSKEVADILGVHPGTIDQYRFRGEGPRFFSPAGTSRVWYAERDVLR
jgi:hypothetical protein